MREKFRGCCMIGCRSTKYKHTQHSSHIFSFFPFCLRWLYSFRCRAGGLTSFFFLFRPTFFQLKLFTTGKRGKVKPIRAGIQSRVRLHHHFSRLQENLNCIRLKFTLQILSIFFLNSLRVERERLEKLCC